MRDPISDARSSGWLRGYIVSESAARVAEASAADQAYMGRFGPKPPWPTYITRQLQADIRLLTQGTTFETNETGEDQNCPTTISADSPSSSIA